MQTFWSPTAKLSPKKSSQYINTDSNFLYCFPGIYTTCLFKIQIQLIYHKLEL